VVLLALPSESLKISQDLTLHSDDIAPVVRKTSLNKLKWKKSNFLVEEVNGIKV
jgi:hypothetical protein